MKAKPKRKPAWDNAWHRELEFKVVTLERKLQELDTTRVQLKQQWDTIKSIQNEMQDLKLQVGTTNAQVDDQKLKVGSVIHELHVLKSAHKIELEVKTPFIPKAYYWVRRDKWVVFQATADGSRLYSPIFAPVLADSHLNVHLIPEPKE